MMQKPLNIQFLCANNFSPADVVPAALAVLAVAGDPVVAEGLAVVEVPAVAGVLAVFEVLVVSEDLAVSEVLAVSGCPEKMTSIWFLESRRETCLICISCCLCSSCCLRSCCLVCSTLSSVQL